MGNNGGGGAGALDDAMQDMQVASADPKKKKQRIDLGDGY